MQIYIGYFLLYLHSCLPSYFRFFYFYFVYGFWYFSALLSFRNPVKFVPLLRLNTGRGIKPDRWGMGGRGDGWGTGGSECLDSDGLMPSDGRCISSDASACCLSSSCVVFLFLCCFFCFFLPPCASRKWLLYGDLCFMRHASAFSSVLRCFFLLFFFFFLRPTPSHPLPSLGRAADHSARFAR